ncbi:hypothetical protein EBZ39_10770 [bacterium]|nr:hypothetical protein [bacterium]
MALQKNMELENSFGEKSLIQNCYIKVETVRASKARCFATVMFYKENRNWLLMTKEIAFDGDFSRNSTNNIQQAYEHLKTLPDFTDATDC